MSARRVCGNSTSIGRGLNCGWSAGGMVSFWAWRARHAFFVMLASAWMPGCVEPSEVRSKLVKLAYLILVMHMMTDLALLAVSAYLMHQGAFRQAILDSLQRLGTSPIQLQSGYMMP